MTYAYTVKRYVVEDYYVEIEADRKPTREEILSQAEDPGSTRVIKETLKAQAQG